MAGEHDAVGVGGRVQFCWVDNASGSRDDVDRERSEPVKGALKHLGVALLGHGLAGRPGRLDHHPGLRRTERADRFPDQPLLAPERPENRLHAHPGHRRGPVEREVKSRGACGPGPGPERIAGLGVALIDHDVTFVSDTVLAMNYGTELTTGIPSELLAREPERPVASSHLHISVRRMRQATRGTRR